MTINIPGAYSIVWSGLWEVKQRDGEKEMVKSTEDAALDSHAFTSGAATAIYLEPLRSWKKVVSDLTLKRNCAKRYCYNLEYIFHFL